jgi:glutathione S-transferase
MKIHGHPWSTNTRKTLMTLAEKGHAAELVLVMLPKGEQKLPAHLKIHPFGKVPVLDDDGFVLHESGAINRYLDRKLAGRSLMPPDDSEAARVDPWISVADSYFVPHAMPVIIEAVFRRDLGGEQNLGAMRAGREGMPTALDAADSELASNPYLAGPAFSLADIHRMPFVEYLVQAGHARSLAASRRQRRAVPSRHPGPRSLARTPAMSSGIARSQRISRSVAGCTNPSSAAWSINRGASRIVPVYLRV